MSEPSNLHAATDPADLEPMLQRLRRRRLMLGLTVALVGIGVSLLLGWLPRVQERGLTQAQFDIDAGKRIEAIQRAVDRQVAMVGTAAAFFNGSELVERHEFRVFATPLFTDHSGTRALGWVPRIPAARRSAHERAVRGDGFPDYAISERAGDGQRAAAAARAEYDPILFIEPLAGNRELLGLDMASSAGFRAAVEQAKTTHRPAVFFARDLIDESDGHSLLCVLAAARNETASKMKRPDDQPERDGCVIGIFDLATIVEASLGYFAPVGIDIDVKDPRDGRGQTSLYTRHSPKRFQDADGEPTPEPSGTPPSSPCDAGLGGVAPGEVGLVGYLDLADLRCRVDCLPQQAYLETHCGCGPAATVLTGLLITALLTGYLLLLTGRALRVEKMVARRTQALSESERTLRAVLDQTYQFIGLLTPEGVLTAVNKSAMAFSGVSEAEVLNRPFWETPWWTHSAVLQEELRHAVRRAAAGDFIRMEVTHLAANGDLHWVDFSLKPVKDEQGKVVFLIPEGRDITDRKRAEQQLQEEQRLLRELLDVHEAERKLVAYEIHDGLAQQLTGALYRFQSAEVLLDTDLEAAKRACADGVALLREALTETRRLIGGLRPPVLDKSGIVAAIEDLVEQQQQQGGPKIEFVHDPEIERLAAPLEGALFRIAQECLTNACRYSHSATVRVELRKKENRVHLEIRDWGVGFDPAAVGGEHVGLRGMRERARLFGGTLTLETAPAHGVCVTVELPLIST